jgi:hypothetical protein
LIHRCSDGGGLFAGKHLVYLRHKGTRFDNRIFCYRYQFRKFSLGLAGPDVSLDVEN